MKAREIKKSLIKERDSEIENYNNLINKLNKAATRLTVFNYVLNKFFQVPIKYDTNEPLSGIERASEPEVDDVPF